MRTVLAIDAILAESVKRKLIGNVEMMGYDRMHKRPVWREELRELVMRQPSVLAIGALAWPDPLEDVKSLRLPRSVPIVALLPGDMRPSEEQLARELGVFAVVRADFSMPKMATCVASECVLALACQLGLRRHSGLRSLVSPPRLLLERSQVAPVLPLRKVAQSK